jgi:hypothetical protein
MKQTGRRVWIAVAMGLLLIACNLADSTPAAPVVRVPEPAGVGRVIQSAQVVGERLSIPRTGDLWMNTWADDDALYLSWGDGTGMTECLSSPDGRRPSTDRAIEESDGCFRVEAACFDIPAECPPFMDSEDCDPCSLILECSQQDCAGSCLALCPGTDFGLLRFTGEVPDFDPCGAGDCVVSRHIPSDLPAFSEVPQPPPGKNDKPSSLLFVDGRLYAAVHYPPGEPERGYIAYSDDYGQTWTEAAGSPWTGDSNFRVLMFINMGQAYNLNSDGYVYGLGVAKEGDWGNKMDVYLARTPIESVADYNAYEYFTGLDGDIPLWSSSEGDARPVPGLNTQEQGSAIYHEGTDRYLFLATKVGDHPLEAMVGGLFEAPAPWGPWILVAELFEPGIDPPWNVGGFWGSYIPGLMAKGAGDNWVYFTASGGPDHYNLSIGRIDFER